MGMATIYGGPCERKDTTKKGRKMSFSTYKRMMLKLAKELFYSKEVIERIRNAESEAAVERALAKGRSEIR